MGSIRKTFEVFWEGGGAIGATLVTPAHPKKEAAPCVAPTPCLNLPVLSVLSAFLIEIIALFAENIYATLPRTQRGQPIVLGADPKGKNFLYTNGNSVIIRNIEVR